MSQETEMALLTHKVESLHSDMGEMKLVMRDVASEKSEGKQNQAATWVFAAVWGAAGLLAMYIAKMLGLV